MKLINNRYKLDKIVYDSLYSNLYEVLELWDNDKKLYMKLYNSEEHADIIDYFINNYIFLSRIKHKNLLSSHQFDIIRTIDGKKVNIKQYYFTIEYIDAPTLDEVYTELNFEERLNILIQVANVLDFLHYKGIVYKYLSPSNIYILDDGSIKLMNLATIYEKVLNTDYDDLTRYFIAPEVLLDQKEIINKNADKYSFGMLALYLLTNDFYNPQKSEFNYLDGFELYGVQTKFFNTIITALIKKNSTLREYKLRDIINGINRKFNLDYKYNLVKERGVLDFQTKIVGREKQIKKILHLDDLIFKGEIDNRVVLIKGDTGTGKTRLLKEIIYLLKMRGRDVYNTEINIDDNVELKPMTDIFRQTIKDTPQALLDKYSLELSKVVPELKSIVDSKTSELIEGERERLRLFDRVTNYLVELSRYQPIYIIIDNLGNCSIQLLYLLDYMINNMVKGKIVLIISYNEKLISEESVKKDILNRWHNYNIADEITIPKFDLSEIGEFIQYILGISYKPLKFSAVMLKESQGNPKHIEYIIKNLYARGELFFSPNGYWEVKTKKYSDLYFPSNMDEALNSQFNLIKGDYMDIMQTISIYNDAMSKKTLQAILDIDTEYLNEELNELISMGLLDVRVSDWGYSYSISNFQLKKLIYYQIPEEERVEMHRKVSSHLEKAYVSNFKPTMDELTYHLICSNQYNKALDYIIKDARENNLYGSQTTLLWEEAYEIDKKYKSKYRLEILENLGNIYEIKGENEKALIIYGELYDEGKTSNQIEYVIISNNGITNIYIKRGLIELALKEIEEAIRLSKEINNLDLLIKSKIIYNRIIIDKGKFEEARTNVEKLLELSLSNNLDDNLGNIYNLLGLIEYYMGNMEAALNRYEQSVQAFQETGDLINSAKPINNIANIYTQYGENEKAMDYYEKGLSIVIKYGISYIKLVFYNNIGSIYMRLHQYDKAIDYIEESRALAIEIEEANVELLTNINLGIIHLLTGNYEQSYNYYSILKESHDDKSYSVQIMSYYNNFLSEFYFTFGQWEKALKYSEIAKKSCKEFSISEYLDSKTRIILIKYFKDGLYDKNLIEELRSEYREENINFDRRNALLHLTFIPFLEGDYEYAIDILKEDGELLKDYSIPKLDYIRKILLYSLSQDEHDIQNLIKLENSMKKHNLPHIDIIVSIIVGFKFLEKGKHYQGINYLLESEDRTYGLIKNIPDRELQKGIIKNYLGDKVKKELIIVLNKVFGIKLDCIYIDELRPEEKIEKYFNYRSVLNLMKDEDFDKIAKIRYISDDIKDIQSLDSLISKFTSDYEYNLNLILKYLAKETFAQKGYILMYDEDSNKYLPIVSLDGDYNWIPNDNLLALANRYEKGVLISNDIGDDTIGYYREFLTKDIRALICIPIRINDLNTVYTGEDRRKNKYYVNQRNVGYIYLETGRVFNRFDELRHKLAYSLTQIIYINMENYKLKILSTIDKLTGTKTRKYFEQEYKRIFDEAQRQEESFAVLMLDIDDFKEVNDTYGHRKGDEVLSKIGKCLVKNTRNTDFVARYGGEEFIIILRDIIEEEAKEIGEKIRANVEKIRISNIKDQVTISIGISMFPKHGQFREELIEKADQALYRAKEKGKNRVVAWDTHLSNTLHRVDRLAGIISGNTNQDQRNVLSILDIVDLVKKDMCKEDKIFEFLGRVIETIEAETCTLVELNNNKIPEKAYSRSRLNQEWVEKPAINYSIVEKVIVNEKGEFLIDWENVKDVDIILKTPNWQSVIAFPIEYNGQVKAIVYITVPLKEKEFDYNSYNMASTLGGIFSTII